MNLEQIRKWISGLSDEPHQLRKCLDVLFQLQKTTTPAGPAPLLEVISVIKAEKPILFHILKNSLKNNPQLHMLLEIPIEYEVAKQRLGYVEVTP